MVRLYTDQYQCHGYDVKLIRCVVDVTLNSFVVVQGMTVKLQPYVGAFERVDQAVSGGKPPSGQGVDSSLTYLV